MTEATIREVNAPVGWDDAVAPQTVLDILARHDGERGALIAILQDIQDECGYVPERALRIVAEQRGASLLDLYGIATFYHSFSLKPRGKRLISVCLGTACHVRGAPMVVEEFERRLGVRAGETTPDREFTLQTVNCLGACALGPIVAVDGRYYSNVNTAKVREILEESRVARAPIEESAMAASS